MKITIVRVPTGIHTQLTLDVEDIQKADDYDLATLSRIVQVVKEYNDYQDEHA